MPHTILIRGARQLLTLNGPSGPRRGDDLGSLGLIQDGAVLIIDGVISAVGPTRRVENLAEARTSTVDLNAAGHVVMPAFIDPHTHLFAIPTLASSSLGADAPADTDPDHLNHFVTSERTLRALSPKTIQSRAQKLMDALSRHGTLTAEVKSGCGFDEATEMKLLRVVSKLAGNTDAIPAFFVPAASLYGSSSRDALVAWFLQECIPYLAQKKLTRFVDVECDAETDPERVDRIAAACSAAGLQLKLHADGSDEQLMRLAAKRNVVSIDGMEAVSETAARVIAGSSCITTLMPGDAIAAQGNPAPARRLISSGTAVAIGSGLHHTTTSTYNMQSVLSLATSQLKMTAAEAISAATINAAHVVGCARHTGSLQYGKDADLLILEASDYRDLPYYFGVNQVILTMKRGNVLFQDASFRL